MSVNRPVVMVIVGTRPEVIKMSRIVAELDRFVRVYLVHSGQNYDYELNQVFYDELEIRRPDRYLDAVGDSAADTIGRIISRADKVIAEVAPDALLLYGDTNTCLSVIPAKRRHVPVFHLEAGNRSYDDRVPEEINRRLIDHLSDVNLALTEHARRHLLAEGLPHQRIFVVGSPMREVLEFYAEGAAASTVHARLGLRPGEYVVVSAHREENVDRPEVLRALLDTVNAVAAHYGRPVVVSTHPRTRDRLDRLSSDGEVPVVHPLVRFQMPFGFFDYVALQRDAWCVVSDSGTVTEEASLMGFPAVMIREAHERPEGMDRGVLVSAVLRPDRVVAAVDLVTTQAVGDRRPRVVPEYAIDDVSRRVTRIVVSYLDVIDREVWHRAPQPFRPDVEPTNGTGTDNAAGFENNVASEPGVKPDQPDPLAR